MAPTVSYLCGMAATVFVAVSMVIAAVRWFHMCQPYDRNPRYYYPGRPFVIGIYLNALMLLPYALSPANPDAWYLARIYFLPVTLFHFTILLFSYFGTVMQWKQWRFPMIIVSVPVVLTLLAAFVMAVLPGDQVGSVAPSLSWSVPYVLGIIVTGVCITAMAVVLIWAGRFDTDDFSNEADFPVTTARRWVILTIVNVVFVWVNAIVAQPALMAVVMLLFSTSSVILIISALHPHRNRPVHEEIEVNDAKETSERDVPAQGQTRKRQQEILTAIYTVVVEQQAYLDAHLTIQDVADRSGYSRSALSSLFKAEFGGFFNYINRLRLQHVETYLKEHPGSSIQEAALESGFNTRQNYYSVKSKLEV